MAVGNSSKYRWATEFQETILKDRKALVLKKEDDGGALYRKGPNFSLDKDEVVARVEERNFDGYLLEIKESNKCNYPGIYFINKENFNKNKILINNNAFSKYHVSVDQWTKLEKVGENHFVKSNDSEWQINLKSSIRNGTLSGLKHKSDVVRFHRERALGVY